MFGVFLLSLQLAFAANPSPGTCDYYLEKEKETGCFVKAEEPSDYLLNFGYRLCHIYHQKANSWNDERSLFVKNVSFCLQQAIEKIPFNGSCKELEARAYSTHPHCYVTSGYCKLSASQKSSIIWTAVAADALSKAGNKSMSYWFQLLKECNGNSTTATVENSLAESM